VLVHLLGIRREDVGGFDEVPQQLVISSGKTLARRGATEVLGGTKEKDNKAQLTVTTVGYADGMPGIPQVICAGKTLASAPTPQPQDFSFAVTEKVLIVTEKGQQMKKAVRLHALADEQMEELAKCLTKGTLPVPFCGIEHDNDMSKRPLLLSVSRNHWADCSCTWELVVLNVVAHRMQMDRRWRAETGKDEESPEWMMLEFDDWWAHRNNLLWEWLYAHRVAVNPIPPNATKVAQAGDVGAHALLHQAVQSKYQSAYNAEFVEQMTAAMAHAQAGEANPLIASELVTKALVEKYSGVAAMRNQISKFVREAFYDTCGPGYKNGFVKAGKAAYWDQEFQVITLFVAPGVLMYAPGEGNGRAQGYLF